MEKSESSMGGSTEKDEGVKKDDRIVHGAVRASSDEEDEEADEETPTILVFANGQDDAFKQRIVSQIGGLSNIVFVRSEKPIYKNSASKPDVGVFVAEKDLKNDRKPPAKMGHVDKDLKFLTSGHSSARLGDDCTEMKPMADADAVENKELTKDCKSCSLKCFDCDYEFDEEEAFECPECENIFHEDCIKMCGGEFGIGCGLPMCRDCMEEHGLVCKLGPEGAHFVLSEDN